MPLLNDPDLGQTAETSRSSRSLHASILEFDGESAIARDLPPNIVQEAKYCREEGEIDSMLQFERRMLRFQREFEAQGSQLLTLTELTRLVRQKIKVDASYAKEFIHHIDFRVRQALCDQL